LSDFNFYGYNNNVGTFGQASRALPATSATMLQIPSSVSEPPLDIGDSGSFSAESSEVPYNVGDQTELTDNNPDFSIAGENLRPILSTRDYFRRFQPVILDTGLVFNSINLFTLLQNSSHYKLFSLYYGFFGSIKVKIAASPIGSTNTMTSVYYYPPHVQASTASPSNNQPYSNFPNPPAIRLNTTVCTSSLSSDNARYIAEFVVPFNSPFKFVTLQNYLTGTLVARSVQAENDLGCISVYNAAGNAVDLKTLDIWIAFGDDARMGFQTCVTFDSTSESSVEEFRAINVRDRILQFFKGYAL
jgi:hypothetical protein